MIYIVLPAFNEEEGLEKLLVRIKRVMSVIPIASADFEIVIVNDGSTDHTKQVVQSYNSELRIHLIDFYENRGIQAVFDAGFAHVLQRGDEGDVVITMDSDNTQNPFIIIDLLESIKDFDLVIASRFCPGGSMVGAGFRGVLSKLASIVMRACFSVPHLTDYSIFYRAYRLGIIKRGYDQFGKKYLSGESFSCMVNMLLNTIKANPRLKIKEVPLTLRYDLKEGGSGIKIGKTIIGYLKIIIRDKGGF